MNDRKAKPSTDYTKVDNETGELLHDEMGREIPDPTPMQPPIGYTRQPTLAQQIREQIIGHNLAKAARESGLETFEEADDFVVGDDWDQEKNSPYEANFDPMTAEERAALSTQGRDPERILTAAEKAALTPKPKQKSREPTRRAPVSEALSAEDPADESDE